MKTSKETKNINQVPAEANRETSKDGEESPHLL
jgi:hypothetical protein